MQRVVDVFLAVFFLAFLVAIKVEEPADFGEREGDEAPVYWCWVVGCGRVVGLFVG